MKNSTKIVLVALAAIVLVTTVAVLAPRAVHAVAVVATLVEDVDSPARHPWAATCSGALVENYYAQRCTVAVPAGYEYVIQTISISGPPYATPSPPIYAYVSTSVGGVTAWWQGISPTEALFQYEASYFIAEWTASTTLYADPGTSIACNWAEFVTTPAYLGPPICYLTGYAVKIAAGGPVMTPENSTP